RSTLQRRNTKNRLFVPVFDWLLNKLPMSGIEPSQGTRDWASVSVSISSPPSTTVYPSGTVAWLESFVSSRGGGSVGSAEVPTNVDKDTWYLMRSWSPSVICGITSTEVPASSVPPKLVGLKESRTA